MSEVIDLRSDTVTRPSPEMRRFMAKAEVGDDGYGDDPSINELQRRSAEVTGKKDALYLPSGTMANLVAIMSHTRPGDSVVLGQGAHSWLYESGGPAQIAGVMPYIAGADGTFTWEDVENTAKGGQVHMAPTTLVMMENTHNAGGGIIFPQDQIEDIAQKARFWGLATHIDGARIFNAAVALGKSVAELCAPVDSVSFCLSKGLGCPVGSVVCGSKDFIERTRRYREVLGGGMRQAGIVAAAGIYALDHNVERLQDDHDNAKVLAEKLVNLPGIKIDLEKVQTNMVFIELEGKNAFEFAAKLKEAGVLVNPLKKNLMRAVTHLDVTREEVERAAKILSRVRDEH